MRRLPEGNGPNEQKVNWTSRIPPPAIGISNVSLHRCVEIVGSTISLNLFLQLAKPKHPDGYLIKNTMLNKSSAVHESPPHSVFVVLQ